MVAAGCHAWVGDRDLINIADLPLCEIMIEYRKRRKYKYNLHSDVEYSTGIRVKTPKDIGFLKIDTDGGATQKSCSD